ncbi:uncharacterized protein LOC118770632 [Megalops cyprinoides]|uniref:uncharacterized protein LOC118770632 n=1 Tax=Megalops cyprinoides TaxID=118141 RepID=UPI001864597A|nr:uncharacterized protein LOC118770632 [Megalops cyprinoides]
MNKTELQFYIAFAFTIANCTVLLFTLFVGLAANIFVIWAVVHQKSLQTSNNALLVNLAVIDLLRCAVDCPLLLLIAFRGYGIGDLGALLCDAQMLTFSFSCCVQLLTLACISAERYQAIANPFQTKQRRRRIMVWIPLTWAVAILLSVLCLISAKDAPVFVKCTGIRIDALPTYDTFGRYILVPVWSGCLAVIIAFYSRIFFIVRTHNRKIFDKGVFPPPKQNNDGVANDGKETANEKNRMEEHVSKKANHDQEESQKDDSLLIALPAETRPPAATETEKLPLAHDGAQVGALNSSAPASILVTTTRHPSTGRVITKMESQPAVIVSPKKETSVVSCEVPADVPPATKPPVLVDLEGSKADYAPDSQPVDNVTAEVVPLPAGGSHTTDAHANPPAATGDHGEVAGAVCMMPSFANRERASKNKEGKLAKRSGYIILTFLLFWTPLVLSVLVNFVNRHNNPAMEIAWEVEILSVSVACMTSATNPITYAVVNPQFRTEFQNLRAKCYFKMFCSKP